MPEIEGCGDARSASAQGARECGRRAQGRVLPCCAVAHSDVVLESRQVTGQGAFAVKKMPARVTKLERVSHDVIVMRLQVPVHEAFQYHAGQYVEILLKDGDRRSYSMANAPQTLTDRPGIELHLRHMPGGKFTDQAFGTLKEKDLLRVEGPYGSFYLRDASDKPIIFLASGTGFAPIKALIEHMQAEGIARTATVYWGGRRPGDLYYDAWLQGKLTQMPNLRYVPVISDALPQDAWAGRTGFVHQAVLEDYPDLSGHQVYACGAPIVVDSAREAYTIAGSRRVSSTRTVSPARPTRQVSEHLRQTISMSFSPSGQIKLL